MRSNILREKRTEIDKEFILSFHASDSNSHVYIKSSLPQIWGKWGHTSSFKGISTSDYEATLSNYFKSTTSKNIPQSVLLIVGEAGTGKSSAIRNALINSNICENCSFFSSCDKNYPERILVDFIEFRLAIMDDSNYEDTHEWNLDVSKNFWFHIQEVLEFVTSEMDAEEEISEFWPWLFAVQRKNLFESLSRLLAPDKHLFKNASMNSDKLMSLRRNIATDFANEDLAKYRILQIAYLRRNGKANCNLVVFDNIDVLPPFIQRKVIDFGCHANRILGCKVIIPLRPYTGKTNRDASTFFEVLDHWKPNLKSVFEKRLENFRSKGSHEVYFALRQIIDLIINNNLFREIFIATSGKSVRIALKNFYNLLLSPIIITHEHGQPIELKFDTNTFFQAFFCTESEDQLLREHSFQNMFAVKKGLDFRYLSNIKLRLLHLIFTNKALTLNEIRKTLRRFGYQDNEIYHSVNEFLDPKKALMWSSNHFNYDEQSRKARGNDVFKITHLGSKYWDILVCQPMYFRECITSINQSREIYRERSIELVLDSLRELEAQDKMEIEYFLKKGSVSLYYSKLRKQDVSISHLLWMKMRENLKRWIGDSVQGFDFERNNVIRQEVEKLIALSNTR